jgi:hypothetical protein
MKMKIEHIFASSFGDWEGYMHKSRIKVYQSKCGIWR